MVIVSSRNFCTAVLWRPQTSALVDAFLQVDNSNFIQYESADGLLACLTYAQCTQNILARESAACEPCTCILAGVTSQPIDMHAFSVCTTYLCLMFKKLAQANMHASIQCA